MTRTLALLSPTLRKSCAVPAGARTASPLLRVCRCSSTVISAWPSSRKYSSSSGASARCVCIPSTPPVGNSQVWTATGSRDSFRKYHCIRIGVPSCNAWSKAPLPAGSYTATSSYCGVVFRPHLPSLVSDELPSAAGSRAATSLMLVEEAPDLGVFHFRLFERDEVAGRQTYIVEFCWDKRLHARDVVVCERADDAVAGHGPVGVEEQHRLCDSGECGGVVETRSGRAVDEGAGKVAIEMRKTAQEDPHRNRQEGEVDGSSGPQRLVQRHPGGSESQDRLGWHGHVGHGAELLGHRGEGVEEELGESAAPGNGGLGEPEEHVVDHLGFDGRPFCTEEGSVFDDRRRHQFGRVRGQAHGEHSAGGVSADDRGTAHHLTEKCTHRHTELIEGVFSRRPRRLAMAW